MQETTESDGREYAEEEKVQVGMVETQHSVEETKEQTLKQLLHISDYHANDIFDVMPFYPHQTVHLERGGGELLLQAVNQRKKEMSTTEAYEDDQGGRVQSGRRENAARRGRKMDKEKSNSRKFRSRKAEQSEGVDLLEPSREVHASVQERSESKQGSHRRHESSPVQIRASEQYHRGENAVTEMRSRNALPTVKPSKAVRNYQTPQNRGVFQLVQLRSSPGHQVKLQAQSRPELSSMGDTQRPAVSAKTKHSQTQ